MMETDGPTGLERVTRALTQLSIPYAVAGSLASSLYGIHRFTNNVDIIAELAEQDTGPLAEVLGQGFYADVDSMVNAVKRGECFNVLELASMDKFDVFVATTPHSHLEIERSVEVPLGPEEDAPRIRFITAEDTILTKLVWFRAGREASTRQLSDVIGVMKVQAGSLDIPYLQKWSDELGVRDLYESCRSEAGEDA